MKKASIVFGLLLVDQGTKFLVRRFLSSSVEILSFFHLQLAHNSGVAFSFPISPWAAAFVAVVVIGFLFWFLKKDPGFSYSIWGGIFVFAGALGNLIDRIFFQSVTDFLSFWSFPIFNFADIFITVGIGLFLLSEVFKVEKE